MPAISRHKDLAATGHTCTFVAPVIATARSVYINDILVARPGDPLVPHTIKKGIVCKTHYPFVNSGSRTVFAEGKPVARIGDWADNTGSMLQGSPNVFAG